MTLKFDSFHFFSLVSVKKDVLIATDAYEAANDSHALVICTEWDEFKVIELNLERCFFNRFYRLGIEL